MNLSKKTILVATITCLNFQTNAAVIVTGAGNDTTGFIVESIDLLQSHLSSTSNNLVINNPENNAWTGSSSGVDVGTVSNLIDGFFQTVNDNNQPNGARKSYVISGGDIAYTLDTTINTFGYDISSIGIYTGWADFNRNAINVTVSYSTVASPMTFVDLTIVTQSSAATRFESAVVTESSSSNLLASGVKSIKFTFGAQEFNGVGYKELDVIGIATIPEPSSMILLGLSGLGFIFHRCRRV